MSEPMTPEPRNEAAEPTYGPCPTRIRPGDKPNDWPWRYDHAASIEGAHWDIYTALGDVNRDYLIGMVVEEADAKSIVDEHNAALAAERAAPKVDGLIEQLYAEVDATRDAGHPDSERIGGLKFAIGRIKEWARLAGEEER